MEGIVPLTIGVILGIVVGVGLVAVVKRLSGVGTLGALIRGHLGGARPQAIVTRRREHPHRAIVDAMRGLDAWLAERATVVQRVGVPVESNFLSSVNLGTLLTPEAGESPLRPTAVGVEPIDVGEDDPVDCPRHTLWLLRVDGLPVVLLWTSSVEHTGSGVATTLHVELGFADEARGPTVADELFEAVYRAVQAGQTFRGKVLSLEGSDERTAGGIKVHRLRRVGRDDVVLPAATLAQLDRNVIRFARQREALKRHGMSARKGLLFYGPPGVGKTHTLHYLHTALAGHTTLLVTAEQIGELDAYMTLARLLQPSVVVIEDVDLIGGDRSTSGVCEQSMLNRLLNEMDGLREDAAVLFLLTTNRPEALEAALAARPGRVDQAIEFPLPGAPQRRRLAELYAGGLRLADGVLEDLVRRTDGVSAAFIKELLRRALQFHLECRPEGPDDASAPIEVSQNDVDEALDELLHAGGLLNRTVLGGGPAD